MEEVKYVEDPKLNERVSEIIKELKEEIISHFHPKSIILTGSFGRGEATVREENGKMRFLSDCEIIIIPYHYVFNRSKADEFELGFYERTGLKVGIWGATLSFYLLIPFMNKKMKPTMNNYDLKYGSRVIYGEDYLKRIPDFKPEDIPLWEGIRLLFNRMVESLEHFSMENPSKEMVFWTDKILLACQDALLLSLGEYHYSYRKRNEKFQNLFPKYFGELEDKIPNFLELAIEATERKLNGTMNIDDPIRYWFDAAEICDKVFRYVIKKDMGIEFKDYLGFQERYLMHPKIKTHSCGFFSHPVCQNFKSFVKMLCKSKKIPSFKLIKRVRMPWKHIAYSLIPLLYFSLSKYKGVNKDYLSKIKDFLVLFIKEPSSNNLNKNEFKYIKKWVLYAWYAICC